MPENLNDDNINENIQNNENNENIETTENNDSINQTEPINQTEIIFNPVINPMLSDINQNNPVMIEKEKEENKIFRWNINDEKNHVYNKKLSKSSKIKPKNVGIKVFAVLMAVMFLLSASFTTILLLQDKFFTPPENSELKNNDKENSSGSTNSNNSAPVISNQDALDETKNNVNNPIEDTVITIPDTSGSKVLSTEEAIAKVNPSVVCIQTETEVSYGRYFGRNSEPYIVQGVGTGFIVSDEGYIATNYHVIESADKITVTLFSGDEYEAEIIGGDEVADLAIIKIDANNLPVAELGDSDALIQGQDVVAIGTPAGIEFAWTATKGIVSSINRDVDVNGKKIMSVIQTDASINPGNSGGPLINMKGQVIGINSMKLASYEYEGMGFAIPVNVAIPVFNDIIANPGQIIREPASSAGDLSEVSFGLEGRTVDEEESDYYNIPQGWKIGNIIEDGPCWNSGLQLSDIIVALDGITVESTEDLYELKLNYKPGDKVIVTIYRNGDLYDFEITLAAKAMG